jgi:putative peptidoglycan lipid II flippase
LLRLGGPVALAKSAWMGVAQASDVLETLRIQAPQWRWPDIGARLPRLQLRGPLTRELTVAEGAVVLMASFFLSALLGAVRQVLFNARFGTGVEANAYYAAFRLPDTLFSLIAGGALSSAMIPVLLSASREGGRAERAAAHQPGADYAAGGIRPARRHRGAVHASPDPRPACAGLRR